MRRPISATWLSCRAFSEAAQGELFRTPVITDDKTWAEPIKRIQYRTEIREGRPCSFKAHLMIFRFVRSLLMKPWLADIVRHLRLEIVNQHYGTGVEVEAAYNHLSIGLDLTNKEIKHIFERNSVTKMAGLKGAGYFRRCVWEHDVEQYITGSWAGLALAKLENLESLTLATDIAGRHSMLDGASPFGALFGGYFISHAAPEDKWCPYTGEELGSSRQKLESSEFKHLAFIPGLRNLLSLRIEGYAPIDFHGLEYLSNTHELDLFVYPNGTHRSGVRPNEIELHKQERRDLRRQFTHIRALCLDANIAYLHCRAADFLECLRPLLHCFDIAHLGIYGEQDISDYTNGRLDSQLQPWFHDQSTSLWDLVDILEPFKGQEACLRSLALPGGFWTLPRSKQRNPIPFRRDFPRLHNLCVPEAAVFGIPGSADYRYPDSLLAPEYEPPRTALEVLPRKLEMLTVLEVRPHRRVVEWLSLCHEWAGSTLRLRQLVVVLVRDEEGRPLDREVFGPVLLENWDGDMEMWVL
ncbi:hypothetical protein M011DRAFT_439726 [Sporormia fimetaria CBS 119925]|uniref:Uncharacterized protein n=1 Tax=Sporormia fimetaria CBS 119925 TaxID=1340428 RepID=A0A6A6VGN2_9PLEO|nr:hypothetical protein M011DRAFT_439726 [Sporormia fimetaria CBS 119925]